MKAVVVALLALFVACQVWDVPQWYAGYWGCGPTSTVMATAYFKKLAPKPISIDRPYHHENSYGWYLPNVYTAHNYTFNRMQTDSKGNKAWGAYGHCTEGGGAWAWRMQDYLGKYKIQSKLVPTATFNIVKTALKSGKLVILSTQLTSAGHIILVRGFTSTGSIIANDPYGNAKERGTYGSKINGEAVVYDWAFVKSKWMLEVWV